ncbi:ImuA family protein [Amaricoccus tamworthensis]|uniref:ImuA family protein n=1 Tax=Amaricoccus tamworthensis TaxID=57002 RepID=UPI003C7E73E8
MFHTRHTPKAKALSHAPGVDLALARTHEVCGPSRRLFAVLTAGKMTGPVLWLRMMWNVDRLMGDGIRPFLDPGRVVFGEARTPMEILWAAEEALRSGLMPLVVADLPGPPGLTPVRRLHLAAATGHEARGNAPMMLLLTPGWGGAPGIETRWHMAPRPGWARDGKPRWKLSRTRARMAPEQSREMWLEDGQMRFEKGWT